MNIAFKADKSYFANGVLIKKLLQLLFSLPSNQQYILLIAPMVAKFSSFSAFQAEKYF